MIKNRKQMLVVIGAFILTLLLGTTTYAFFNYTRTGTANNIKTGKIYFNADQGNNTVTLSDLFPISVGENEEITASTPGVGSLKLHITGDTTYEEGIEYLVEAVDVEGNGQTSLPISINISYAATSVEQGEDPNVIGTNDEDYFTNRGGDTSRYKLLSEGSISEGEDILVGYIAPGAKGIDGELTILAYLDAKNIAITDTYDEDEPETNLNGTTTNWVDGRTVFTTEEWNALQATGVSFKIKTTANEGTWVENPIKPICKRATQLHVEKCTNSDSTYFCQGDIYHLNDDITYGSLGTSGSMPSAGDAFDCDVNGDGIWDSTSERFYYVSDYYDTKNQVFDNSYATLIYYSNTFGGIASTDGVAYDSSSHNNNGPVTAIAQLPTTAQWSNIRLKNISRAILAENENTHNSTTTSWGNLPTDFSYEGYAARLITVQEIMRGCGITSAQRGSNELENCRFFLEETSYANNDSSSGWWTETPRASYYSYAFVVTSQFPQFTDPDVASNIWGVRPAIEIPYLRIKY